MAGWLAGWLASWLIGYLSLESLVGVPCLELADGDRLGFGKRVLSRLKSALLGGGFVVAAANLVHGKIGRNSLGSAGLTRLTDLSRIRETEGGRDFVLLRFIVVHLSRQVVGAERGDGFFSQSCDIAAAVEAGLKLVALVESEDHIATQVHGLLIQASKHLFSDVFTRAAMI